MCLPPRWLEGEECPHRVSSVDDEEELLPPSGVIKESTAAAAPFTATTGKFITQSTFPLFVAGETWMCLLYLVCQRQLKLAEFYMGTCDDKHRDQVCDAPK